MTASIKRASGLVALAAVTLGCSALCRINRGIPPQDGIVFFSDLGPATIDVAGYPQEQQKRYALLDRRAPEIERLGAQP